MVDQILNFFQEIFNFVMFMIDAIRNLVAGVKGQETTWHTDPADEATTD